MKKKKILLISNMYPSKSNKHYGIFVKNTEDLLRENGYIVKRVVMTKQKNIILKLINYILLHLKVIFIGLFGNIDYLYVHFISHSSMGAVIVKKIKKNIKLVLNCHGNDIVADNEIDLKNIERSKKYLKYADRIVVPSNYFKDVLMTDYGVKEDLIFVYPSGGVDTKYFKNIDVITAKKKSGLGSNYNYIGYISRIDTDKGYDTFVYMIKELEKKDLIKKYNLRFLIVGSGNEEERLNDLIKELQLESFIERKDLVSQEELLYLYNSLELFIFPTYRKSDSLGLVGLEAMSCETFVIASNKYGPSCYMKDNINGFTFESEDYKDLTEKVIKYFELDEEEITKITNNARETAIEYDTNNTKDKILEVFK